MCVSGRALVLFLMLLLAPVQAQQLSLEMLVNDLNQNCQLHEDPNHRLQFYVKQFNSVEELPPCWVHGDVAQMVREVNGHYLPAAEHPKMFERFYSRAYKYVQDTALPPMQMNLVMPEIWVRDNPVYQQLYSYNSPQVTGLVYGALRQAVSEELLSLVDMGPLSETAQWYNGQPITQRDVIEQNQQRWVTGGVSIIGLRQIVGNAAFNVGGVWLGGTYDTLTHQSTVRLSYPFLGDGFLGEVGVDSRLGASVNFQGRW